MKKTQKIIAGISTTALALGLTGCGNEFEQTAQQPEPDEIPQDASCSDWEWDSEDGVWECDDSRSAYYGHYLYGGHFYKTKSLLKSSTAFKNYQNSSSFKGTSGTKGSTGFGSGSRSSGS
jgi:hypothetical protein